VRDRRDDRSPRDARHIITSPYTATHSPTYVAHSSSSAVSSALPSRPARYSSIDVTSITSRYWQGGQPPPSPRPRHLAGHGGAAAAAEHVTDLVDDPAHASERVVGHGLEVERRDVAERLL